MIFQRLVAKNLLKPFRMNTRKNILYINSNNKDSIQKFLNTMDEGNKQWHNCSIKWCEHMTALEVTKFEKEHWEEFLNNCYCLHSLHSRNYLGLSHVLVFTSLHPECTTLFVFAEYHAQQRTAIFPRRPSSGNCWPSRYFPSPSRLRNTKLASLSTRNLHFL